MFVELETKAQIELFKEAIKKAGSERKLGKAIRIPNSSLYYYKTGSHRIPYNRFQSLLSFLNRQESDFKFKLVDPKTFRIKGGKATYQKYLVENRFNEIHKKMRAASSKRMKEWHAKMKEEEPEKYYKLQYNRFKKIADYKLETRKGHFVRNKLELQVADFLFEQGIDYEYEPYVKCATASYFPDFKCGNLIIECTMWKGIHKAYVLLKKIKNLEEAGYTVKVIIPNTLTSFYKPIEKNIISTSELVNLVNAPVAQTEFGFN